MCSFRDLAIDVAQIRLFNFLGYRMKLRIEPLFKRDSGGVDVDSFNKACQLLFGTWGRRF